MPELITEKELHQRLGVGRRTFYLWRMQGMPFRFAESGVYRYLYDYKAVKSWAKENGKKLK